MVSTGQLLDSALSPAQNLLLVAGHGQYWGHGAIFGAIGPPFGGGEQGKPLPVALQSGGLPRREGHHLVLCGFHPRGCNHTKESA